MTPRRPSVVFLLADQWRGSATGYAGDPNVRTPRLDRMARRSLMFRNAVSVCPICTPYRAALLTGRYPTSTGMFLNDLYLPSRELTLAEVFRGEGYDTAYIGKWHLDGHGRDSYIPQERRQGWDYWKAAECEHAYLKSHYYEGSSSEKRWWQGYDAFAQTDDAIHYLRGRAGNPKPFVLFVSYGPPHNPHFELPEAARNLYDPDAVRMPPNVAPELLERSRKEASGYYAHCELLDGCVGRILDEMERLGIADDSITIFTSDHGDMLGSQGCGPFTKQVPWSESAVVPLLLRYPRLHGSGGRIVETPLNTPDLAATLLGLAGIAPPPSFEGEDLSRVASGGSDEDRASLYMLISPFHGQRHADREYRAIRTMTHTYVRSLDGPWLLYDDARDPYQLRNLIGDPASDTLRARMEARLQSALLGIGDRFSHRKTYIDRFGYELADHGSISYAPGARPQTPRPQDR